MTHRFEHKHGVKPMTHVHNYALVVLGLVLEQVQMLHELEVKHQAEFASQNVIDMPFILCDIITPLPVYHMVNIEWHEGEY